MERQPGFFREGGDEGLRQLLSPRRLLAKIKEIKDNFAEEWEDFRQESYNVRNGMPYLDRGGPVSLSPSADGPLSTLARIELNARSGRPLEEGLDHPDQLNQRGAP
jgi:hypothetical protein